MDKSNKIIYSAEHMQLEIERIINHQLYKKKKINTEIYSQVENSLLKDINRQKNKSDS